MVANLRSLTDRLRTDRRKFMFGGTAAAIVGGLSGPVRAAATHRRKSLQGTDVAADLQRYAKAVKAMLALPPEDPRNWYRNALTHVLDCPHGNWWFLVWHRGYLGYFEQICREVAGEPDFALPYWDWTQEPKVPDAFWDDVLNPDAPEYISSAADFDAKMRPVAEAMWNDFTPEQLQVQMTRGAAIHPSIQYSDFNEFWASVQIHFTGALQGRNGSKTKPNLDFSATNAVANSKIIDALAPDFLTRGRFDPGFESGITDNHHQGAQQSTIEQEPHNLVHNSVGGLMSLWLSPVDPIFFMHHANIDRLWDVWARKQANSTPPLPDGPEPGDEVDYSGQEFLFFHDANGDSVTLTEASNYTSMAAFDYEYEDGTGEDQVPVLVGSGIIASNALPLSEAVRGGYAMMHRAKLGPPGDTGEVIFSATVYMRGAWTLHALRLEIGDGAFFATLRAWCERYGDSVGTTEQLRAIAEEKSGKQLKPFFEAWVYGAEPPVVEAFEQPAGAAPADDETRPGDT